MVGAISGRDIPSSMAESVHQQTGGNPLFIQEVLRYLLEEGLVDPDQERRWRAMSQQFLPMISQRAPGIS